MKKIKDFLPDDVRREVNTALVLAIERYADCTDREIERVLADFLNIWDEKTTAELEGVEPSLELYNHYYCGNCDNCIGLKPKNINFCYHCGTKIKWSE